MRTDTVLRERTNLDRSWRFSLGNAADPHADYRFGAQGLTKAGEAIEVTQARFDDRGWREVELPHDWAVELPFDLEMTRPYTDTGSKPLGRARPATTIGWYRRRLDISAGDEGRRIWVEFDGVFRDCIVWLNGHLLRRHLGGYTPFRVDLTDALDYGGGNVLTVRVDAGQPEGWFYEGAGICRHVWMVKTHPLHVEPDSLFVPYVLSRRQAMLDARLDLANDADAEADYAVEFTMFDPAGRTAAKGSARRRLRAWARRAVA
jgi:beta-galactosidase